MMKPEHGIADGFTPLRCLGQSDTPAAIDAVLGAIVALPHMLSWAVDAKGSDRAGDVAHVIPSDQPTRIADAGRVHIARCQQKPRRFQSSGRQNEPGRDNIKSIAVERFYRCLLDPCPVRRREKARAVRMKQHPHIRRCREPIPITPAKVGWAAEPFDSRGGEVHRREVSQHRAHAARHCAFRVVDAVPRLTHSIRARIKRGHLLVGYGPTAVRDPGAMLEVHYVQRHATSAPDCCRTAEPSLPIFIRRAMQQGVGDFAFVKRLVFGIFRRAACLQQHNPHAGAEQFQRDRNTGRARSDNANVGLYRCAAHDAAGVTDHRPTSLSGVGRLTERNVAAE